MKIKVQNTIWFLFNNIEMTSLALYMDVTFSEAFGQLEAPVEGLFSTDFLNFFNAKDDTSNIDPNGSGQQLSKYLLADDFQSTYLHKFLINPLIYIAIVLSILMAFFVLSFSLLKLIKIQLLAKVKNFFQGLVFLAIPI